MKKIVLATTAVALIIASSCNSNNNAANNNNNVAVSDSGTVTSAQVAYVNMDSLVSKYDLYINLSDAYQTKASKAESDLSAKSRSLENAVRDYETKIQKGLVTRAQAQKIEEDLTKKQQNFIQQRDKVLSELSEEEQVMLNQIHHNITTFLEEFNADHRFGIIISTNAGGPILNADPALDITKEVLVGLNKKYAAENKKQQAAPETTTADTAE